MSTAGASTAFLQTTDAEFRTWVAQFITDMGTIGWVQSGNSGQINTATVAKPAAAGAVQGYAVFTPNDGLTDFYLVVGFGAGDTGAAQPAIYAMVGWEIDSSVTLIGVQHTHLYRIELTNANSGLTCTPRLCKVGSAFWFCWNEGNTNNYGFGVDRLRDVDGTPNTDGVVIIIAGSGNTNQWSDSTASTNNGSNASLEIAPRLALGANGGPLASGRIPYAAPNTSGTWARGGNVGAAPIVPWLGGPKPSPLCAVIGSVADVGATGNTMSVSLYGTAHTFRNTDHRPDSSNFGRILMLWE